MVPVPPFQDPEISIELWKIVVLLKHLYYLLTLFYRPITPKFVRVMGEDEGPWQPWSNVLAGDLSQGS